MTETPRPTEPTGPPKPEPRRSRRRVWIAATALVAAGAAAAGGVAWRADDPAPKTGTPAARTTPGVDVAAQSAAVDAILNRRAQAVLRRDGRQFLADVDPTNKTLLAGQKALFANLVQFGFSSLRYTQSRSQFEQALVDKHGPTAYLVTVLMTYQIKGIDLHPVRTLLGYTFVQRGGRWLLIDDDHLDSALLRGSHREPWDVGPVLVRRAPRVLVVVERGAGKLADSVLADARSAVRAVNRRWPVGWRGSGVVIALDDLKVRQADYTKPKNAEDVLAMATRVFRTLPGEVESAGQDAGAYIVVNPRYRHKLDARSLAHEFTHVATAPYGAYAPAWLAEGAAQYVELLPMDGEADLDLAKYRRLVRSKYLTKAKTLPDDAVFYANMNSSYPIGWLAVDHLIDRYGAAKVIRMYQDIARRGFSQTQRDLVMVEHLGRTEARLFAELKRAS